MLLYTVSRMDRDDREETSVQVRVKFKSGSEASGVRVKVGGYEGRTNRYGIVNLNITSRETRKVYVDGSYRGEYKTPDDLDFTI